MSRNRRKDGFHGRTGLAWRSAVGAASQIHRESNHGEIGKGARFSGLNPRLLARGFRSYIMVVWNQIMVFPNHGSWDPKQRPLLDRHTHTRHCRV